MAIGTLPVAAQTRLPWRTRLGELLELGDALLGEQLVDRVALVHGDHGQHGLAAEELLVLDVVLVDLIGLVEVAVLAGGELEAGDAEAQDEGDDQPDDRDQPGSLAQLDGEP